MDEAGGLFLSAFSAESQQSVKLTLVYKKQLQKAKDGSNINWEDLITAAETEVQVNKGYTNFSSFSDSNQIMQKGLDLKKGDGKQREQMLKEVPNKKAIAQEIKDIQQKLASLQQQMANPAPSTYNHQGTLDRQEFTRGNAQPSTPLFESQPCFYCRKEGHSTYQCPEASKDRAQGLVRKEGKDWYLPNGEYIPWNPSRPIHSVVAAALANPQMQEAIKNLAESHQGGNGKTPTTKALVQTIHWSSPTLGTENFIKVHPITRSEAQKGRRGVRIQEPEQEAMDIDHEGEELDNTPKDTLKKIPEKVWS
ncbi:hypothetical protein PTTG_29002 [Puccinia triticina 1-1 BBBD Race 1]|uniref:CCHC-type domain-containing protein n=1 Tax=Puccinia triticina (isolate 1-1 / race 1 (BBBD)) TaxID=630390 RepID=A0A180G7L3_PUCT1|nr:hypothetical protein PTTG_29002 [Puccinia triticina 1-1 BBBD Race 1]